MAAECDEIVEGPLQERHVLREVGEHDGHRRRRAEGAGVLGLAAAQPRGPVPHDRQACSVVEGVENSYKDKTS